jgi:glyoxylase-like metal-dependent hydrolase (beta-lactamase superfamily II)
MPHPDSVTPFFIDLPQRIPGWDHFIRAWVIQGNPTIVVDVGPQFSINTLSDQLHQRGITEVDYVWLTHIHIDHAGGLASFLKSFPSAKAVVQAKGLPYLIDPTKLWEGSLATLKEKATAYGPIEPVAPDRLISHEAFSLENLTILDTPGHAPFHLSYSYRQALFCGESAGVYVPLGDKKYLRPPTPPRFFFEQTVGSVDKMLALADQPIYFGHVGHWGSSHEMLHLYRKQLHLWKDLISEVLRSNPVEVGKQALEVLLKRDPLLAYFPELDALAQERERFFMGNSVAGFLGYLKNQAG